MEERREQNEAFVTLATNDTYALGCLVLGSSLRNVGTTRQLVVMVTDGVSEGMKEQLRNFFDQTVPVNVLDSSDTCNLELLGRPDLSVTFTKFHCWRLTQYKKCVFMDADTLVIQNVDDLFDREELSAAPDAGWPDCFNSGVFVFVPSDETYRNLLAFAITSGSFDGGDQGLLNLYFRGWATEDIKKHLPFTYNVVSQAFYSYLPAFKQFYSDIKIVHFIGAVKPWHHSFNTSTRTVTQLPNTGHSQEFLQLWWDIFMTSVQPKLDPEMSLPQQHQTSRPQPSQPNQLCDGDLPYFPRDQRQQAGQHGHSETRGSPTTSYTVLFPYVPPSLEADIDAQESGSQVVDVPVVYRDYKTLETHYSEEPLSAINPELPQAEYYSATETLTPGLVQQLLAGAKSPADEPGLDCNVNDGSTDINTVPTCEVTENCGDGDTGSIEDIRHSKDGTQKGGLVGDLASMTLQGEGSAKKDDRERKLQWEQGQADYMGVDRFDNIKARLDEKMSKPPSDTKLAGETHEEPK
ncbi:glycogenin-1-like [Physella acuta]|uniref:glycogenin-1-like n=1 Tax=Physella acuta TaxID=109671 RepID=UPI0027DCF0DA|nr:glycogenin-1-like [Physella acuta]